MIRANIEVDKIYTDEVIISTKSRRGNGTANDPIRVITEVLTKKGELIAEWNPAGNSPESPPMLIWRDPKNSLPLPEEGEKYSMPVIIETTSGSIMKSSYNFDLDRWACGREVARWMYIPE